MTLRLDYLSPLPPVRSGISDYSVDLLPHLAAVADVRVIQLPDLPLAPEMVARWRPAAIEETGRGGRVPLYHMGNNSYHAAIAAVAAERPGVLVLHDLVLHHFLLDRTVGQGRFEPYRAALERDHGWIGEAAARPVRWGAFGRAAQFFLPAHRTLLRRQRGVLVHGHWAAAVLAEEDAEIPVRVVPMGIPLPPAAHRARGLAFRSAHGIPAGAPVVGSFGFQTPIKRTEVAIRALAAPGLEQVQLLVAGELSPYANYAELAAELGVAARVHVTGFLPFEELDAAIAATDVCLNLRYPSAGETSASLLRILAVGRPVLVSEYAELGDLPEEVARPIPLGGREEAALAAALTDWLLGPEKARAERGAAARRFIAEHHEPARAAAAIVAAVRELAEREPPGDRPPAVPPRSSAIHVRLPGRLEVAGLEGWRPGERRELVVTVTNISHCRWLPSHELPGGLIFEVQHHAGERDLFRGRSWLSLASALDPGRSVSFELELRKPLGPSRLLIKPTVQLTNGHRPFGDWAWDRWL